MEGGAVDALLFAGDDILRSVELCLSSISWWKERARRMVPDDSRIEGVQ